MKKQYLFLSLAIAILTACSSPPPNDNQETSSSDSSASEEQASSSESVVAVPTWSSMEEAIVFYENALVADLGEELAGIGLNGEFYERDSWELIENSGNIMVLSMENVGYGGRDTIEFIKETEVTYMTFFQVDSPYPDNPISRWTVRNSDMAIISKENLRPLVEGSLSPYSSAEIEYARVWLEVIGNQNVEELNITYHSAGEPLNPYEEEESATYPEDVTVLSGKTTADGSVIYSSNGDGTINLYEVPSHWQVGVLPEGKTMREYTTAISNNPRLISISTGNDEEVIQLIQRQNIQN